MQERIIGAIVLVVVAVIVVPVFLNGPSGDTEIVSEPVLLPGQGEQERKQQTIVLDRERTEPMPSATTTAQTEATPQADSEPAKPPRPAPAVRKPVADASAGGTPTAAAGVATESSTGMWAVQLGSFSNQANAERLAADLRKQGYAAFLSQLETSEGSLHRVRVGPQKDRESAEAVAARLKAAGHPGQVVPHP